MIAGNSGLPWGGCGKSNYTYKPNIEELKKNASTQEESIISNWIKTTLNIPYNKLNMLDSKQDIVDKIYKNTTKGRWGMIELDSTSTKTIQDIDYTKTKDPLSYSDAWVVSNCKLSKSICLPREECSKRNGKKRILYAGPKNSYKANLIFVAGPNCGAQGSNKGTMKRTLNKNLDFSTFRECIKQAFKAGLKSMILSNLKVVILAKVSGGIYAGKFKESINKEYLNIIDELLDEPLIDKLDYKFSDYFEKIYI